MYNTNFIETPIETYTMINEKFQVPGNLSLTQTLDLLYTIVQNQFANISNKITTEAKNDKSREELPNVYKELTSLLHYVNDGLKEVERYYNIPRWSSLTDNNESCKNKIEDFQIIGHDIRVSRRNLLESMKADTSQSSGNLVGQALSKEGETPKRSSKFFKGTGIQVSKLWGNNSKKNDKLQEEQEAHDKELIQKAAVIKERRDRESKALEEMRMQDEIKKTQRAKDVEEQQKKLMELEIEHKVKKQIMKKIDKKRENMTASEVLKSSSRNKSNDTSTARNNTLRSVPSNSSDSGRYTAEQGGRRSFDMTRHRLTHRKDAMHNSARARRTSRRSLDITRSSHTGDSSPPMAPSVEQNINKAALLAWSQHEQEGVTRVNLKPTDDIRQRKSKSSTDMKQEANKSQLQSQRTNPRARLVHSQSSRTPSNGKSKSEEKSKHLAKPTKLKPVQVKDKGKTPLPPPTIKQTANELQSIEGENVERSKDSIENIDGIDPAIIEQIKSNILDMDDEIHWDDVAGLTTVKTSLKEAVVYPFLRPDLFKGLREPIRGMLLFGPPGTGKTMIAKAIATESKSTFFNISASSLLSKYLGESEKLVKALFFMARKMAPSIIFIDEIDSILGNRSDNENESSRRIKTELLIQWSGLSKAAVNSSSSTDQRVLVLAATNLPWVIDDAARRRFSRRLYVPLPDDETRLYHLKRLLSHQTNNLSEEDLREIVQLTQGYSGSDLTALAKEAAMEPIRELGDRLMDVDFNNIRHVEKRDFITAMETVKKSVSPLSLARFDEWAKEYGSMGS